MSSKGIQIILVLIGILYFISCNHITPPDNAVQKKIKQILEKQIQKDSTLLKRMKECSKWKNVADERIVEIAADKLANYTDDQCFQRSPNTATSAGHRQDTQDALADLDCLKNNPNALEIIKESNVDTDYYFWNKPAAHAQTDDSIRLQETEKLDAAQREFCTWVNETLNKAVECAKNKQDREALRWFGISLHAVQDIEYHNGMNNKEHSYYAFWTWASADDPDNRTEFNVESSKKATKLHLERFQKLLKKAQTGEDVFSFKGKYEPLKNYDEKYARNTELLVDYFWSGLSYRKQDWTKKNSATGKLEYAPPRWKDEKGIYSALIQLEADDGKSYNNVMHGQR